MKRTKRSQKVGVDMLFDASDEEIDEGTQRGRHLVEGGHMWQCHLLGLMNKHHI